MFGDVDALVIFATVVERGGFTAAASALGIPKTTVSRKVALLEERLGTRLLQRTTRRVSLTDFGRVYFVHCQRIVDELRAAAATAATTRAEPGGLLRVTTSVLLAQSFLGAILADFVATYPAVRLELDVSDGMIDLLEDRFDLAFRAGRLPDSSLVTQNVGMGYDGLYAAPGYLKAAGRPAGPDDLAAHILVEHGPVRRPQAGLVWTLRRGAEVREVSVSPRAIVGDALVASGFAKHGRGVARLPTFVAAPGVLEGSLVPVLPEWTAKEIEVNALFPSSKGLVVTVRALVDFAKSRLATSLAPKLASSDSTSKYG
jgi:DNA-binding transcriptional LysR family regulator